jgi:glycosyltransferase involved in cell wall biosynthesis
MAALDRLALLFDADVYVPKPRQAERHRAGMPAAVPDRQVAGRAFLDGLLQHGQAAELLLLVRDRGNAQAAGELLKDHPAPRARSVTKIVAESDFAAPLLHFPGLIEPRYLWAREASPGVRGFTGWLSSPPASLAMVHTLQQLALAPTEPCDALICSSAAVRETVRALLDRWSSYLRQRFGGDPASRLRLEVIPPCIDLAAYRPASAEQRLAQRLALGIAEGTVVVLCVGPLSLHLRASPVPLVQVLSEAARQAGQPVHLLLAGGVTNEAILRGIADGVRLFGPNLKVSILDPSRPPAHPGMWQVADLFAVGGDSPHECATVPILQAMSTGLPVVAADWAGARELVAEGQTGFLIPTALVRDATGDATTRLVQGETGYDPFLAELVQTVVVDSPSFRDALARLIADAGLRRSLGEAGRRVVEQRHSPASIVGRHETLWAELAATLPATRTPVGPGPTTFPVPESLFAALATSVLEGTTRVQVIPGNESRLFPLQSTPATGFAEPRRCRDLAVLNRILAAAREPVEIGDLDAIFRQKGIAHDVGRGTIAWLLKYGVLRVVPTPEAGA